jgi:hypothetical protein
MADTKRDPRVEPKRGDAVRVPDGDSGGHFTLTVTESRPRHVHADRIWPDGLTSCARFWIREWRMYTSDAQILHTAPDEAPNG